MTADVSRETWNRYRDMLLRWNARVQLISPSTIAEFEQRHLSDSLQILQHLPNEAGTIVDLGSGGGLPAVPLAIASPASVARVIAVESDARKAAFLNAVSREIAPRLAVRAERAEAVEGLDADVVTARAFAPLRDILPLLDRHLRAGGRAVLPKGARWREEVDAAGPGLAGYEWSAVPSRTDPEARLLLLDRRDG